MTHELAITVPFGHDSDPLCPHCEEPIGDDLVTKYPETDPHSSGGEHHCLQCGGALYISVFRPNPVFAVSVPQPDNVKWLGGARRRRQTA
jgi:hypothetical protein